LISQIASKTELAGGGKLAEASVVPVNPPADVATAGVVASSVTAI
jgi:hypothetical protein